jgi:hypothetical protein
MRQDLRKSDAYMEKPIHVRVRVFECNVRFLIHLFSINNMCEVYRRIIHIFRVCV